MVLKFLLKSGPVWSQSGSAKIYTHSVMRDPPRNIPTKFELIPIKTVEIPVVFFLIFLKVVLCGPKAV